MPITQIIVGGSGVTWHEQINSGAGEVVFNSARSERRWLVTNCYDPNELIATAPDNIPTLNAQGEISHIFRSYKYDPCQPTDGGLWQVVAEYQFTPEYYELSFDSSGATTKLITAIDDGTYYNCVNPSAAVPNFNRLVGVTESSVEGTEVPIRKFDFTVLIRNRFTTLPSSYIETIADLSGHANDRPLTINWKGQRFNFETEELLFLGMPGKMTSDEGFELSLKFSKSKGRRGGTWVTDTFVQPDVNDTVVITVYSAALLSDGQYIFIVGGGDYLITDVTDEDITIQNLGGANNSESGTIIAQYAAVSADQNDREPLVIGNSGAIAKPGWRYLWTNSERQLSGGRFFLRPKIAVVNKVIRTADLNPIGIFS